MLSALSAVSGMLTHSAVSSTAVAITAFTGYDVTVIKTASRAIITARTGGVMYTYDGTTPTTTVGHYLGANQNVALEGVGNIRALKFIREASTDAAVSITLETDQS